MTTFIPTTTVTVQRGEGVDAYGDAVDTATTIATGVPAAIADGSLITRMTAPPQVSNYPVDQRGGITESYTIRLRPRADVLEGDRLIDERVGITYLVRSVFNPQSPIGMADVRVIAQRVGALSQPVNG